MKDGLSNCDKWYLMETAMLECSVKESVSLDDLYLFKSKKGVYYIVDKGHWKEYRAKNRSLKDVKIWFKIEGSEL